MRLLLIQTGLPSLVRSLADRLLTTQPSPGMPTIRATTRTATLIPRFTGLIREQALLPLAICGTSHPGSMAEPVRGGLERMSRTMLFAEERLSKRQSRTPGHP